MGLGEGIIDHQISCSQLYPNLTYQEVVKLEMGVEPKYVASEVELIKDTWWNLILYLCGISKVNCDPVSCSGCGIGNYPNGVKLYDQDHFFLYFYCIPTILTCPNGNEITNEKFQEVTRECFKVNGFEDLE